MSKVIGVIVTYKPNMEILEKCIESLATQLNKLIIVDNTPGKCKLLERFEKMPNIECIYLNENYGIAYAQNVGIKRALEERADFILISDQDTIYPLDYVEKMLECFKGNKMAACGPVFKNTLTGEINPIFKEFFKKEYVNSGKHEVFQMIASGMILNSSYLTDIGLMKEELFIDYVDHEWCWRARKRGYKLLVNADVKVDHLLGYSWKKIIGKNLSLRNHIRYYYLVRNITYLSLYSDALDFSHKINLFSQGLKYLIAYPLFAKPHFKNLKYTLKGFYHGLIGKLGKLEENH
jgi:Predicted glycosyltransferases